MLLACLPIDVVMRLRKPSHRWDSETWIAAAVTVPVPDPGGALLSTTSPAPSSPDESVVRLDLELYSDENDAYFENWAAPQPKVFVMWQLREKRARPVLASVSYAEGTRMLDSGEQADGLPMSADVHSWLGAYLRTHYRPRPRHRD